MIQKEGYLQAQGQLPIVINADIGDALADVLTVVDDGEGNLVASWQPPAAPAAHNHAASEITSGTIANDRLPATALTDDIPKSLIDAAGDIIYGSADNTPARLAKGTDGHILTLAAGLPSWAAAGGGLSANSIIVLQHRENQNVDGGTITVTAWNTVPFNYELNDAGGLCSLSSNRFTLTAGTYLIFGQHTVFSATVTIPRLYNYTDATEVFRSHQIWTSTSSYAEGHATLMGVFTIGASKALEFQIYATSGQTENGYGHAANVASEPEIYGAILLIKLS